MVERISRNIVSRLIDCEVIEEADRELYEYAAFNKIFGTLPFFVIIPFALLTGRIINAVILITVFLYIRTYAGGFHARTPIQCFLGSCTVMTGAIYLTQILDNNICISVIVLISGVLMSILSPVESENKRLESDEKIRYRRKSRILICLFVTAYFLLTMLKLEQYAVSVALGIVIAGILQVAGLMKIYKNA